MKESNDFRKLAHLFEQLGKEGFDALLDPKNTGKVKIFCNQLLDQPRLVEVIIRIIRRVKDFIVRLFLPTKMTIGERKYKILSFLRKGEKNIAGHTMVERAKEMNADLGEKEGQYLLEHQHEIPDSLRGEIAAFIFTDWRRSDSPNFICYLRLSGNRWVRDAGSLTSDHWEGKARVLRRIA